jgi:hypothetical protein
MANRSLNLGKVLKLFALPENKLISELRDQCRKERDKLDGEDTGGNDFYGPFWSDAKAHVAGRGDLSVLTLGRIEDSKQRRNLYPRLSKGFLEWFDELRRSTNLSVGLSEERFHNRVAFEDLKLELKVDNLLTIKFGDGNHRLVYPYFAKEPILLPKWAKVGLWGMAKAFPAEDISDFELLDDLRGTGFSVIALTLDGDEELIFRTRYKYILEIWNELRPGYGLP